MAWTPMEVLEGIEQQVHGGRKLRVLHVLLLASIK